MFCKNCGKQISSITQECPYCKTKVNETTENIQTNYQQTNSGSGLNKNLYNGMNGKPVPMWKFILGIILLGGGIFIAFSAVL